MQVAFIYVRSIAGLGSVTWLSLWYKSICWTFGTSGLFHPALKFCKFLTFFVLHLRLSSSVVVLLILYSSAPVFHNSFIKVLDTTSYSAQNTLNFLISSSSHASMKRRYIAQCRFNVCQTILFDEARWWVNWALSFSLQMFQTCKYNHDAVEQEVQSTQSALCLGHALNVFQFRAFQLTMRLPAGPFCDDLQLNGSHPTASARIISKQGCFCFHQKSWLFVILASSNVGSSLGKRNANNAVMVSFLSLC